MNHYYIDVSLLIQMYYIRTHFKHAISKFMKHCAWNLSVKWSLVTGSSALNIWVSTFSDQPDQADHLDHVVKMALKTLILGTVHNALHYNVVHM